MAGQKKRPRAEDFLSDEEVEQMSSRAPDAEEGDSEADLSEQEDFSGSELDSELGPGEELEQESEEEDVEEDEELDAGEALKSVSFGDLSKAQDNLARKRKRDTETEDGQKEDKLGDFRARLAELKRQKLQASTKDKKKRSRRDSTSSNSSSGSAPSEDDSKPKSRSSKHAPASQSSRYQVSRKREVVDVPKRHIRDPRFGPLPGTKVNKNHTSKAYDFLHSYAEGEMKELRTAIKKSRNEDEKAILRRKLMSMENQARTRKDKDLAAQVDREHRKAEKEAIAAGKKPHYLKKSERARLVQVKRYESLTAGQREKVIEKRARKTAQKEKKSMPAARRIG